MAMRWIHESPSYWDTDKVRIVGGSKVGIFPSALIDRAEGTMLPNDWWRVTENDQTVGYGWMDVTWGDAEILLAVAEPSRGHGVGTFILDRLEQEALERGLHYLYNAVSETHPQHDEVSRWLEARNFTASDDGKLLRAIVQPKRNVG